MEKYKNIILKYRYLCLSILCFLVLSFLMYVANAKQDLFESEVAAAPPIDIYKEEKEENKIEVTLTCIDLENMKLVDVKEKISLNKYLQNPEYTLVKAYLNYVGDGKVVSPICNYVELDKAYLDGRKLKIDLVNVGDLKYDEEVTKKISGYSNDSKKLAISQTLRQLKDVDEYEITLNGDKVEILSYVSKIASD